MAESCGWLFVDFVPLLYEKKKVARQLQVETWLDLAQLVEDLRAEDPNFPRRTARSPNGYIV